MINALVIGNGESRRNVDLSKFSDHTLIGCNAIHRDHTVEHLVCCDRRMAEEAINNPDTADTNIYVRDDWWRYYFKIRKHKNTKTVPELPYKGERKPDQPLHWGSGGYAVLVAASLGFKNINLLGFDLYSTPSHKVNNIYKGTENYSKHEARPVDPSFWIYQIAKVFQYYPSQNFKIINDASWKMPKEWQRLNVSFENISQYTS